MRTRTNAQVALQTAMDYTPAGFPNMVLERAEQFKSWLDEADAKDKKAIEDRNNSLVAKTYGLPGDSK